MGALWWWWANSHKAGVRVHSVAAAKSDLN